MSFVEREKHGENLNKFEECIRICVYVYVFAERR